MNHEAPSAARFRAVVPTLVADSALRVALLVVMRVTVLGAVAALAIAGHQVVVIHHMDAVVAVATSVAVDGVATAVVDGVLAKCLPSTFRISSTVTQS
jgi:hypothetical protein